MSWMRDHHQLILSPWKDVDSRVRHRPLDERDVHSRLEKKPQHRPGIRARRADPRSRKAEMEAAEHRRKHVGGYGRTRADPEDPALEPAKLGELLFGYPLDAEQLAGPAIERSSGFGQPKRSTAAIDQR